VSVRTNTVKGVCRQLEVGISELRIGIEDFLYIWNGRACVLPLVVVVQVCRFYWVRKIAGKDCDCIILGELCCLIWSKGSTGCLHYSIKSRGSFVLIGSLAGGVFCVLWGDLLKTEWRRRLCSVKIRKVGLFLILSWVMIMAGIVCRCGEFDWAIFDDGQRGVEYRAVTDE